MKKKIIFLAVITLGFMLLNGCLSVETKEYNFKIKKDGSGTGTIKYINIMSDNKDSVGAAESDYQTLVDSYLKGDKLLEEFPGVKNMKKRLFEEDNQLCGEVTFDFDKLTDMKFYKYKDSGPWCYYLGMSANNMFSSESFFSSNGEYAGQNMPVVFWESNTKDFKFKTTLTAPGEKTISLLDLWKSLGEK
ncbi:MAG: hypothetical protein EHM58_06380 [Ignavibacteriae bacterium]|nr:MAG: hypothetical protein EHM58_06380 [Ignavibacteriota bacterium]